LSTEPHIKTKKQTLISGREDARRLNLINAQPLSICGLWRTCLNFSIIFL